MQSTKDPEREQLTKENINSDRNQTTADDDLQHAHAKRRKYIKWGLIGAAVVIVLVLVIVLPIVLTKKKDNPDNPPGPGPNPPGPPIPPGGDKYNPYVVDPAKVVNDQKTVSGVLDLTNSLFSQQDQQKSFFQLEDDPPVPPAPSKLGVDWKKLNIDKNNEFGWQLGFSFDMLDYKMARFTLTDANDPNRYSIPEKVLNKPQHKNPDMRLEMLGFNFNLNPFTFSFTDVSDPKNTFVTNEGQTLVFMDKYIQLDLLLPSQRIYGFGERVHEFGLGEGTYTMWASGQDSPYDDGKGRKGTYGVHPFMLVQSGKSKDDYFGLFFRNSNMQSPVIRFTDDGKTVLSYITIGGQIELYFFIHGSAKEIIQQYHNAFGKPYLPPFWSLGWQQASWKYQSQDMVADVVKNYKDAKMPLEAVYFDIPYLNQYADFTIDTKNFPDVKGFADSLHANNQKLVVIIDAALSAEDTTSKYYTQGNTDQIFIQSSIKNSAKYGKNLVSEVWPKKAVFIDWLHDKCPNTWNMGLADLYQNLPYDGLWLDMNEATTFANGEVDGDVDPKEEKPQQVEAETFRTARKLSEKAVDETWFDKLNGNVQTSFDTYQLPFVVRNSDNTAGNYDNMTLSLNATHPGWNGESEYNLHSLYGHMMAWRTNDYLSKASDNRPFILTRSTFASSGRFASHWLGDNLREWRYLRYSIAGIMNMNMFGIPHVGADVCGFFGEKRDDNMCYRWIQLSTFYPFARAHQNLTYLGKDSDRSEPYLLSEPYKTNVVTSLHYRYSFLRMMYTCLFEVNQNGGSCFDPLFYHFPLDDQVYQDYEAQFMVANAVMVSPVLEYLKDGVTTYSAYIPQGKWVNLADYTEIVDTTQGGASMTLNDRPVVNAHLKSGTLIPFQEDPQNLAMTTADLLKMPITVVANRDANGFATGTVFLDQGISQKEMSNNQYEYYRINHQAQSVQFTLKQGTLGAQPHVLKRVLILDADDLSGVNFACAYDWNMQKIDMFSNYDPKQKTLEIRTDQETALKFSDVKVIYYGSSDKNDVNMCDSLTYQYKIADGKVPDLTQSSTTFVLQHIGNALPNLQGTIQFMDQDIINVKWSWQLDKDGKVPSNKRTPVEVPNDIVDTRVKGTPSQKLGDYIDVTANPFTVKFKPRNRLDKNPYLTIQGQLFDQYLNYINVNVKVPADQQTAPFRGIFGLGERANKDFFYEDGVYTIYGKDQGTPDENGKPPAKSMYGTHPFYVFRHDTNSWAGVFTKLAHASDWYIKNSKDTGNINIRTFAVGGIADIYVMVDKQEPEDIIERYYSIVGDPVLVPQWALGWNQCKWGYNNVAGLQASVDGYKQYGIPLDVQWSDIDYMDNYKDFTYDQNNFKTLPDFINSLHQNNQKYVPILDIGIAMRPGSYPAYDDGVKDDVFLKIKNEIFIGRVWPNEAAFPDFFNPKTVPWWQKNLDNMYSQIQFDGLWEDMNEVSNFCNGVCYDKQKPDIQVKNLLPYSPAGGDLEEHTAALDAYHANGYLQLDTHSYQGSQEVKATHEWFTNNKRRTFIIERSSMAGMGKFGSRWLGDNYAAPSQMGYSVTGVMLMNMFGIPLSGVDICGFGGDTWDELCARWHVLGAFYPFSRNHNSLGQKPQEPWQFQNEYEPGKTYMSIMIDAIQIKYSLVRYYYTQLLMTSMASTTGYRKAMYKPVFFEYPEDPKAYDNIKYNVMLGDALKLSINSDTLGQNTTVFYFPAGVWCDILNPRDKQCFTSKGEDKELGSKAYDMNLHLREGYLVPMQNAKSLKAMTTADLQKQPVGFHALPSQIDKSSLNWRAQGIYANDDGLNIDVNGNWNQYQISVVGQYSGTAPAITETILFNIVPKVLATKFQNKDDPLCYAVNQNDYLSQIALYNAGSYKQSDNYSVSGTTQDGKTEDLGTAQYDTPTNRIVFNPANPLCLTKYSQIAFVKA